MIAGNFAVFPFLSVVQMLMASGKTGELELLEAKPLGSIWLENGHIVHARAGSMVGETAMELLITNNEGRFHFNSNAAEAPEHTLSLSGDLALRQLFSKSEAWRPLLEIYDSWDLQPEFSAKWDPSKPLIYSQFLLFNAIDRGQTLFGIVEEMAANPDSQEMSTSPYTVLRHLEHYRTVEGIVTVPGAGDKLKAAAEEEEKIDLGILDELLEEDAEVDLDDEIDLD